MKNEKNLGNYDKPLIAEVWEVLLDLALPVVKQHRGDLLHDAVILERFVDHHDGRFEILYGVRECGTDIRVAADIKRLTEEIEMLKRHNEHVYLVRVYKGNNEMWRCTWDEV